MELNEEKIKKFTQVAKHIFSGATPYIIVSQVDPDALGGAMGLSAILRKMKPNKKDDVRILYCGEVGRAQNRAIINKFDLSKFMLPIAGFSEKEIKNAILVDSSSLADGRVPEFLHSIAPSIIIDHHRSDIIEEADNQFVWLEDLGSSSTMIVELAEATQTEIGESLALLLAIGIYTDTKALVAASARDRNAYGKVTQNISPFELSRLIYHPLPESHFKNFAYALNHMEQKSGRLVVNAGEIRPEDGDDLASIADELLRKETVLLVVVWGIIGNTVRISARTTDLSLPLDKFLKDRFGAESGGAKFTPDYRGEGGARINLGLGIWMSEKVRKEAEALVNARMKELIFNE